MRETCHKTRIVAGCGPFNPAEDVISWQHRRSAFLTGTNSSEVLKGELCCVLALQASQWRDIS